MAQAGDKKNFLDTSVARPLTTGSGQYREFLDEATAGRRYISRYVLMEFRRGLLLHLISIFFRIDLPHYRSAHDAFSYISNTPRDRELRAVYTLILEMLTTRRIDLKDPSQKQLIRRMIAEYIDTLDLDFTSRFSDTGTDSPRCARAAVPLELDLDNMHADLERFTERFSDVANCASRCTVRAFLLDKKQAASTALVTRAEQLVADRQKTKHRGFVKAALHLRRIINRKLPKSAVRIHRQSGEKRLPGLHFWTVGYCVSTVGLDEQTIREYIRQQEKLETGQNKFDFE